MAVNANDLIVGFDPTGAGSITGAQLAQIVNSAYPQADKGMCIVTTDVAGNPVVPNADATVKWQRYLWIRQGATSVSAYVWNTAGADDATYQKWTSINIAGIGAGSIVNGMIADNTISDIKIASLSFSKLTGVPSFLTLSTAATGDLNGSTFGTPTIAPLAITTGKIAANAVTHAQLGALAVQPATDIQPSGSYQDMLRVKSGAVNMEFFTPNDIVKSAAPVVAANALKIPQVNTGATDFVMVAPTTLGRILQQYTLQTIAATNAGSVHCAVTALPAQTTGPTSTVIAALTSTAFTPINAGSIIIVEAVLQVSSSSGTTTVIGSLFQDAIDNAVAAVAAQTNLASQFTSIHLRFSIASWGTGSSKVFKVGLSSVSNNAYLNSTDGVTTMFSSIGTPSWIKITEYL